MDAVTQVPAPRNEPVLNYAPGSAERAEVEARLAQLGAESIDLTMTIGGEQRMGGGRRTRVVQPHAHRRTLGVFKHATQTDARAAVDAAKKAGRTSVLLLIKRGNIPEAFVAVNISGK